MSPPLRIGTSGWHYPHWRGLFYPQGMPPARYLEHYARQFDTVELNNSFYRLPSEEAFVAWRETAPAGFLFAVKASRYLTHLKKLKEPEQPLANILGRASLLGDKLGPVLFQLPGRWRLDLPRLEAFLAALPDGGSYALECRDPSWLVPAVFEALRQRNVAHCVYDFDLRQSPREVTADFVYLRLHGPGERYSGSYDDDALAEWADWLLEQTATGRAGYCYFDNDGFGHALRDAARLKEILTARGWPAASARGSAL